MYVALVRSTHRVVLLITAVVYIMFAAGCGGSSDEIATRDSDAIATSADTAVEADEDHEDHDDEGASGGLDAHVHGLAELFHCHCRLLCKV